MASKRQIVEQFRVQAIQEAALRVIARSGLHGATMQAIASEAGVAKGTLYLYFADREDLVQRTGQHAFTRLLESLEATLSAEAPFPEQVRGFVRTVLEFFDANREFYRLYLALCHPQGSSEQARRKRPRYVAYLERLARLLETGMRRGEARPGDPRRLGHFLAEGLNSVILRRLTDEPVPDLEEEVEWIVETVLHGISAGGPAGADA